MGVQGLLSILEKTIMVKNIKLTLSRLVRGI